MFTRYCKLRPGDRVDKSFHRRQLIGVHMVPLLCEVHLLHFREPLPPSVEARCLERRMRSCFFVVCFIRSFVFFLPAAVVSVAPLKISSAATRP